MENNWNIIIVTTLVSMSFLLNSCETWRQDCTGQIIVENEIPDITLQVGGEPFYRDLFAPPVVFRHTEGKQVFITDSGGGVIARVNPVKSPTTGNFNAIEVTPLNIGEAEITITAADGCDYNIQTSFNVTVVDTTNQ